MDINFLLKGEQISLMRAMAASSTEARVAYGKLARCYGELLRQTTYPHIFVPVPGAEL